MLDARRRRETKKPVSPRRDRSGVLQRRSPRRMRGSPGKRPICNPILWPTIERQRRYRRYFMNAHGGGNLINIGGPGKYRGNGHLRGIVGGLVCARFCHAAPVVRPLGPLTARARSTAVVVIGIRRNGRFQTAMQHRCEPQRQQQTGKMGTNATHGTHARKASRVVKFHPRPRRALRVIGPPSRPLPTERAANFACFPNEGLSNGPARCSDSGVVLGKRECRPAGRHP